MLLLSSAVFAAQINVIYIGTWDSTGSGNSTGSGGPGLSTGQKYVINISYDDTSTTTNSVDVLDGFFSPSGNTMSTIDLNAAGNSLDIFVPMEGLDAGSPFIYTQNETNHLNFFVPNPTLNFTDGSSISDPNNIIGLEFEGDFFAGAGFNVIELFNTAPSGGSTNMVSQILNCGDAGCFSSSIASTDTNGLQTAVGLVVDAGPNVVYNAASLTQGTSSAILQSNDLGAGRSDGEDFIDASWSQTGAATGNDIDVGIANSGLSNTTDTTTWTVDMTEQMTGMTSSDSLNVSYNNAGPTAEAGGTIQFSAANALTGANTSGAEVSDADLAVNGVIANFEQVSYTSDADGNALAGGSINGSTVTNNIDQLIAIADSGLTTTTSTSTFNVAVMDFAGASASDSAVIEYLNANPTINATAIETAGVWDFTLTTADLDTIVNAIIAGFEILTTDLLVDALATTFFDTLLATGSQSATNAALEATFGLGAHGMDFLVTDLAGATASVSVSFDVGDVQPVPEPGTHMLLLAGLLGLVWAQRRRARLAPRTF
jgi:hypothetical protein